MPDPRSVQGQKNLIKLENTAAQQIIRAYERVYGEMSQALMQRMVSLGPSPRPEQVRQLARDVGLLEEIESLLGELASENQVILRQMLTESQQTGLELVEREIERLVEGLNIESVDVFTGIDDQLPALIQRILQQIERLGDQQRAEFTAELTTALIRGDDFETMIRRLFAVEPGPDGISLARRNKNSVELLVRRAVIEANNASRQLVYERSAEQIDGLKKQLVAAIQPDRTTVTCLRAHGQIREVNEPYELSGKPRFSRKIMYPPFHWRCRSSSVAYHPYFERSSKLTTDEMRKAAQEALAEKNT